MKATIPLCLKKSVCSGNSFRSRRSAFTLVELLCVIAVIGLLAALLFPSFTAARRATAAAKTRTQFARWATAIEAFRSEYGFYPQFDASGLVNGGVSATQHPFHDILAGQHRDASPLTTGDPAFEQNRKSLRFHRFETTELSTAGLVTSGAEQAQIAVLVDRDLDGVIKAGSDFVALPELNGMRPDATDFPATGIRAGVIFYCLAANATVGRPEFVFSWK